MTRESKSKRAPTAAKLVPVSTKQDLKDCTGKDHIDNKIRQTALSFFGNDSFLVK